MIVDILFFIYCLNLFFPLSIKTVPPFFPSHLLPWLATECYVAALRPCASGAPCDAGNVQPRRCCPPPRWPQVATGLRLQGQQVSQRPVVGPASGQDHLRAPRPRARRRSQRAARRSRPRGETPDAAPRGPRWVIITTHHCRAPRRGPRTPRPHDGGLRQGAQVTDDDNPRRSPKAAPAAASGARDGRPGLQVTQVTGDDNPQRESEDVTDIL